MIRFRPSPRVCRGVTLIELLLVVAILSMLLAIALTMLRPVMKEMKVREAARMVNAYIAGVQARAIQLDRPVGIYMEARRYGGGQLAAFELFAAESPPPYAGDIETAAMTLEADQNPGDGVHRAQVNPGSESIQILCQPGDTIRFNYKGPWYEIRSLTAAEVVFDTSTYPAPPAPQGPVQVPYQIMRKPRKTTVAPLDLPAPMVIDVGNSGVGLEGAFSQITSLTTEGDPVPIIISFQPTGAIDMVYVVGIVEGGLPVQFQPAAPVHLLIGWSDKLGTENLADNANRWVSIGHVTGRVTTTENAGGTDFASARDFAKDAQGMGGADN
jgi:prepilin-type N-terminal cleavage/methylation domain-containing protein